MKRLLTALFMLILIAAGHAERIEADVDQAVELAVERNLNLKVSEIELQTTEREQRNLWNQFLPSISFQPGFQQTLIEQPNPMAPAGSDLPDWAVSLGVSGQLIINAAMFTNISATRQDYKNGLISFETAAAQLERDVKKSYYNQILLEQTIALFEENLETAQRRYEQAVISYNSGMISRLQMLTAQAMVENLKPQLTGQRHIYQVSLMNFKIYLGLAFDDELVLTENLLKVNPVYPDVEKLLDNHLTDRLDIQLLMGNLEYLKKSRTSFLLGQLSPSMVLGLNYNAAQPVYTDNKPNDLEWSDSSSFTLGFALNVDQLIPGSSTWVTAQGMKDSQEMLKIQLKNAIRLAELDVRSTVMNLEKSLQNIKGLSFSVELNREVYVENEKGYNAGQIDILDLEDAEDSLQKARIDLIREKVTYLGTLADLEYALNIDIEEIHSPEGEIK